MPGVALPILPVDMLAKDRPDFLLILVWNFAAEVMSQQRGYAEQGGRFLLPVPVPRVVEHV